MGRRVVFLGREDQPSQWETTQTKYILGLDTTAEKHRDPQPVSQISYLLPALLHPPFLEPQLFFSEGLG